MEFNSGFKGLKGQSWCKFSYESMFCRGRSVEGCLTICCDVL